MAEQMPDYKGLAYLQADLNQKAMDRQTISNRPTSINPFGTLDYAYDPTTGRWAQKETYDPRTQALIDASYKTAGTQAAQLQQLANKPGFKTVAGSGLFNAKAHGVAGFNTANAEQYIDRFAKAALNRSAGAQAVDREQMEGKLRLQGLVPGSEAYDRAYKNLLTSQGDTNAQAILEAQLRGGQEYRDMYNTGLNSAMALQENDRSNYAARMQGQGQMNAQAQSEYMLPYQTVGLVQDMNQGQFQPYMPNYQGFGTAGGAPGADVMSAAQQAYQQQSAINAAKAQKKASTYSMVGGLIGAGIGAYAGNPAAGYAIGSSAGAAWGSSDAGLKYEIQDISDEDAYKAMQRIAPHSFRWRDSGARQSGLIAQEVEVEFPQLVKRAADGHLMVDYQTFTALLLGAFRYLAKRSEEHA